MEELHGRKKTWAEEEKDSDSSIPSEWDDSEEEESEEEEKLAPKAKAAPAATPKEKPAATATAAAASKKDVDDDDGENDAVSKKMRDLQLQQESDLVNAEELFSGLTVKDTKMKDVLTTINPKTQADFDEFQKALVQRIEKAQNSRYYNQFLEKLIRELSTPLKDIDVRKIASSLTTLANEKQRAAREATKPKKKNKKAAIVAPPKDEMDLVDYSNQDYDEFDDFM
ncbi:Translation initiation factor 3 subunit J component [Coemansia asiatica]|uniref:Eukaryotic translation initiation factor 3 30 kDa subunit n=1 Tax=Coemansia asiatica TaxID=1052880 RepID=A0A9W8CIE5_9FUNG|nr:Translation initiation factor 3 subunit J component [Coemansia asiatica]KAJ2865435.1 Translation initiation factor 3 subunit J component [Coemansia asiatica]